MSRENRQRAFKLFLKFAGISLLVFLVTGFFIFRFSYQRIRKQIEIAEKHKVETISMYTSELLLTIKTDVNYLAAQHRFLTANLPNCKTCLPGMYQNFSISRSIYDQIRFIDIAGNEKVRINFDGKNAYIVPENELRYKGDRYYFKRTMALEKDSVYFSQMDLNIEDNKIEIPLKPMIRIGRKIYDHNDSLIGVLIVNFKGKILLDKLLTLSDTTLAKPLLINSEGYYLIGHNLAEEWGFMYENDKNHNFKSNFPLASEIIFNQQNGSIGNKNGLFTFSTIDPLSTTNTLQSPLNWKVVAHISESRLSSEILNQVWVWIILSVFLALGILISFYSLATNIVFRQENRKALKISNKQLRRSNNTLKKFFSIISHDLRAPFSGLIGLSEMLADYYNDYSDEEKKSMIEAINKSGKNTFELLENLLTWSRSQTNSLKAMPESVELKPLLTAAIALLQENADKKKIHISIDESHFADTTIFADEEMMKAVIRNLLSNALKFTPSGGSVIFTSAIINDKAQISITDSGTGMTENQLKKLFKADKISSTPGTEHEVGSGLGLLLCKEFVTLNGGAISVESTPGQGSTFTINIPLAVA